MTKTTAPPQVHPLWRLAAALVALVIAAHEFFSYEIARSINLSYFHDPVVPVSARDVLIALLAIYLLIIAISGRWWFQPRR